MEPEPSGPRKVRFAPKVPTKKPPRSTKPKTQAVVEDSEAKDTKELLRLIEETSVRGKPNIDKKSAPVQVAFGQGGTSNFIRSSGSKPQNAFSDGGSAKDYKEPWNYYSYYPVTLPLRRPYSGDPVLLDEKEFGEVLENITYDENSVNSAEELGLTHNSEEEKMLFLQLPAFLPFEKRFSTAEANDQNDKSKPSKRLTRTEKACSLEEIPPGFMGKLLVYKSGMVKLKLGDTLYNVSPGSDCIFAQDAVAVNTVKKHCCILGELNKRAIVTPDVDSLLNTITDME